MSKTKAELKEALFIKSLAEYVKDLREYVEQDIDIPQHLLTKISKS